MPSLLPYPHPLCHARADAMRGRKVDMHFARAAKMSRSSRLVDAPPMLVPSADQHRVPTCSVGDGSMGHRRLASCRAPRHCLSRRRRRHATAASSDFFCVPFGGRANGRVSTPPTPSATTAAPAPSTLRVRRLHLRHRLRRLRPALPASAAHLRRDVQLGFRRLRRLRPRLRVPTGPGPTARGPSSHVDL